MLHLHSSVGIARELTERLYDKPSRKIREVVTNALDAGAGEIKIEFLPSEGGQLIFTDNGSGMSTAEFETSFLRIGGSPKRKDGSKVGRIGVGFLAAIFAHTLRVYSRTAGKEAFCAELNIDKLFNDENWETDLELLGLGDYVPFNAAELPPHRTFTKLVLVGLHGHVLPYFLDQNKRSALQEDLRRILPISYPEHCPLLTFLEANGCDRLLSFLNSADLKTIDVNFLGHALTRRVYGEKPEETIVAVKELPLSYVEDTSVWGYALDKGNGRAKEWAGMTTRVKNVAVETSGWLGYDSGGKSHKARVTGELFVSGLRDNTGALNIDRSQLQRSHPQVEALSRYLQRTITGFLTEVGNRKQEGKLVNLSNLKDISHLPSQPTRALASLKRYVNDKLVPAMDNAQTLTDIRSVSLEALRLLGYSEEETEDLDGNVLSVLNPDGDPAFILKMGASEQRSDRLEMFNSMDRLGVAVGVLAKKKYWEIWWGSDADKQQVARVNLTSLTDESLAGLWYISKKVRWMEGRLRKFQDPTMILSANQLLGAILYCPTLDARRLMSRVHGVELEPEVRPTAVVWQEAVQVAVGTSEWFDLNTDNILARVQVQFDESSGRLIVLTAERSVLQAVLHWLSTEFKAEVWGIQDYLRSRSDLEVISYATTSEDQVITHSLREPVLLSQIDGNNVLGWTLGVEGLYLTVFQNNWVALPLYAPAEMDRLITALLGVGGSHHV